MKNFVATYTGSADVHLACAYDVVTVTFYPGHKTNLSVLPLYGVRVRGCLVNRLHHASEFAANLCRK
jgi:hypothetical protein